MIRIGQCGLDTAPASSTASPIPTEVGVGGFRMKSVVKRLATIALLSLPLIAMPAVSAHADPADPADIIDSRANYSVFLKSIARDGIVMDGQQAVNEGIAVCTLMRPPNTASLWDAAQHLKSLHPDWKIASALSFSSRAVQDICPHRGSF